MHQRESVMQQLAPYLTLGVQLAAAVCGCAVVGWWIDETYNTQPWVLLGGVVVGSIVGLVQFLRVVQQLGKRAQRDDQET
jgi:F0F1-type ATP synthase assembly protein I